MRLERVCLINPSSCGLHRGQRSYAAHKGRTYDRSQSLRQILSKCSLTRGPFHICRRAGLFVTKPKVRCFRLLSQMEWVGFSISSRSVISAAYLTPDVHRTAMRIFSPAHSMLRCAPGGCRARSCAAMAKRILIVGFGRIRATAEANKIRRRAGEFVVE